MFERIHVTRHHANGQSETAVLTPSAATQRLIAGDSAVPPDDGLESLRAADQPFWQEDRFERWRRLWERRWIRLTVGTCTVIALGGLWFFFSGATPTQSGAQSVGAAAGSNGVRPASTSERAATATSATSGTSNTARATAVTVHIAGLVARPGVITLPPGARVIDALEAVGGAARDADLTTINLAAPLHDGMQVVVARVGSAATANSSGDPVINLNSATAQQLETLPGIGPTLAGAIVREREQRGAYRSVDDLQRVSGLGARRIADLKDRVQV